MFERLKQMPICLQSIVFSLVLPQLKFWKYICSDFDVFIEVSPTSSLAVPAPSLQGGIQ